MRPSAAIASALGLALLSVGSAGLANPLRLTADQLASGSDAIISGTVSSVTTRWNDDHGGLESRIEISVSRTIAGAVGDRVVIVQPGGELDGARHVIVGLPVFLPGDAVEVHLRRTAPGRFRVYGWSQGVRWLSPGREAAGQARFDLNGMKWEPGQIPVEFVVNSAGSDELVFADARAAITAAFGTWESVACSSLTFLDGGDTSLGVAVDGVNVITWIEADWIFGEEAAGAASLFFAPGQTPTADVALNGQHFSWALGVPSVGPSTQDVQGVMTHELGHFSGLSHTDRSIDTMYFAWTPWQSQRSLSADDKLGLCELYPQAGDECDDAGDCADGAPCETFAMGRLCSPVADPIGASCGRDRVECGSFCLITNTFLFSGYCSMFCDETPCPIGFECNDATAGAEPVRVCFRGAPCSSEMACSIGSFCGTDGFCTFECREHIDCPTGEGCNAAGQCAPFSDDDGGGCGCGTSGDGAPLASLLLLVAALVLPRRRERASRNGRTGRHR